MLRRPDRCCRFYRYIKNNFYCVIFPNEGISTTHRLTTRSCTDELDAHSFCRSDCRSTNECCQPPIVPFWGHNAINWWECRWWTFRFFLIECQINTHQVDIMHNINVIHKVYLRHGIITYVIIQVIIMSISWCPRVHLVIRNSSYGV